MVKCVPMSHSLFDTLVSIMVMAPPVLFAVATHEVAHGFVAWLRGDRTAKERGRLTLNPIKHIDPFGSIVLPFLFYLSVGAPMGFAKPVPVDVRNLRSPRRDMALVAAAGPATNFILAFLSTIFLKVIYLVNIEAFKQAELLFLVKVFGMKPPAGTAPPEFDSFFAALALLLIFSIWINLILGLINLIPILPADGGRIVMSALPLSWAQRFVAMERWGLVILFGLLLLNPFNILGVTLLPVLLYLFNLMFLII